mgnify:FL=1
MKRFFPKKILFPCRVSIVRCDIFGHSTKNQSAGTFGYFDPADLYFNAALENEHSAETQVIYLDSVLYKNYKDTSISVIAHEFNHLLNFVNKEINNNIPSEETWFTEMLSAVAEDLLFDNCLDSLTSYANTVRNNRLPYFNGGYNMGITQTGSSFSQENYGFVLAYGSFLARNYGGPSLINKIATNPYTDEKAITEALKSAGIKKDSKSYVTFEDILMYFVTSVMNENIDVLNSSVKTLNRSVKGKVANTSFSADGINLSDFYQVVNGKKEKTKGLQTFSSKEKPDVGKYGFILQYAGEGTETLNVVIPEYDELHMYCVIQNF